MRKYYLSLIESYHALRKASVLELIFKMNCLHADSARRPEDAGVPMADIREAVVIIKELKRRLVTTRELNLRYCRILKQSEKMAAKDIPAADARELLWIEDELHRRLIKEVGHDFYPPEKKS